MKQNNTVILLAAVCVIMFTSCSTKFRFVTQGLPNTDSSYVITKSGERIDASEIAVRPKKLTLDKKDFPIDNLTSIKSKKMYFVVNDGELYQCEIYGKVNLLYQISYTHNYYSNSFAGGGGAMAQTGPSTTVNKTLYLQKLGKPEIDRFTKATFFEYLSDNEDAMRKARASYIWHYTTYVSFAGFIVGTIYTVKSLSADNPFGSIARPLALVGIAAVTHSVLSTISDNKLRNAILIYNNTDTQ